MKKLYDLAVKVGSYQKDGQEKGRYQNIGAVMEKDDGGKFIIMNRTFNPAGVPNPDNKDSLLVSMFKPKDKGGESGEGAPAPDGDNPFSDDKIPF